MVIHIRCINNLHKICPVVSSITNQVCACECHKLQDLMKETAQTFIAFVHGLPLDRQTEINTLFVNATHQIISDTRKAN